MEGKEGWVASFAHALPAIFWGIVAGFGLFLLGAMGMVIAVMLS